MQSFLQRDPSNKDWYAVVDLKKMVQVRVAKRILVGPFTLHNYIYFFFRHTTKKLQKRGKNPFGKKNLPKVRLGTKQGNRLPNFGEKYRNRETVESGLKIAEFRKVKKRNSAYRR